jgi:Late embryogenesis abundant protein
MAACASLGEIARMVQPPRFAEARDRGDEIRLLPPSRDRPLGGAAVRVWARVTNPNPFGFTLSTLRADLSLEGARAASGEFPLGLPLRAGEEVEVPLDLSLSFADLPRLADAIRGAASGRPLAYSVAGTIGVDAGALGRPTFGPMHLFSGEVNVGGVIR